MSVYGLPESLVGRMLGFGTGGGRLRSGMAAFASKTLSNPVTGQKQSKVPKADRSWQGEVFAYRRVVGEAHYSIDFMGSCMSRLTLVPAIRTRDGKIAPAYDDEGKPLDPAVDVAADLIADLKSPTGGQSQLLRAGGGHLFAVGETFLVGEDVDNERRFNMYSVAEYEPSKDGRGRGRINAGAGSAGRDLPDDALVVRIWQSDLEWADQADSSMRACIDVLRRLALLGRAIESVLMSRLANTGVYWIADEIHFPEREDAPPESEGIDPLTADMIEAFMRPIADRGSASAVVPYIARAPADYIKEGIRYDDLGKSLSSFPAVDLRREAVIEFAQGVNLPLEIVTGQGSVNHWSAFQIDESLFKSHVEPAADTFVDGITGGYLHVMLEAENVTPDVTVTTPDGATIEGTIVCHYDSTELVAYPNRSADADMAHDRMTISDSAHRRYKGFSEGDAPDEEEIEQRIRRKGRPAASTDTAPDGANPGPPDDVQASAALLRRRVTDAAEPYIARAIERAGSRLRSKANGQTAVREALNGATNRYVAATLGPNRVANLLQGQGRESDLFVGEFATLGSWVADHAAGAGFDASAISRAVVERCESLALSRLYDPDRRVVPADFLPAIPG